jgi:hypothetical protein
MRTLQRMCNSEDPEENEDTEVMSNSEDPEENEDTEVNE